MKALFTFGADVPSSRVIADHRRWLVPVGIVLAINIVVLVGGGAAAAPVGAVRTRRAPKRRRRRCARRWPT